MLRKLLEFATTVLLKLVSIVNCSNTRNMHSEDTDLSKCFKQIWCAEKYTCDTCVFQVFHPSTCNYDRRSQYSITSALRSQTLACSGSRYIIAASPRRNCCLGKLQKSSQEDEFRQAQPEFKLLCNLSQKCKSSIPRPQMQEAIKWKQTHSY